MQFSHITRHGTGVFFHPAGPHHNVQVTGSFTGWRSPGVHLQRVDGGWRAEIPGVTPGAHTYKFIVDGRWVEDPLNLVRSPDGGGGHNSVLHHGGGPGMLLHLGFHTPALSEHRPYVVHLPPGYFSSDARFSTVYLLHGALDWEKSWVDRGALLDALAGLRAAGRMGEFIVVMPKDNGDLYKGDTRVQDYLAQDVVGHIDHEFRTLSAPRHRALDGLSTGGFTSVVVGAARSDVFTSIGSMSGSHARRSFEVVDHHAEQVRARGQRYRLLCGQDEPHVGTCRDLAGHLRSRGISVELHEPPGGHDWPLWRQQLGAHLQFHWDTFQAA
mgnify:CR=1 FL=1